MKQVTAPSFMSLGCRRSALTFVLFPCGLPVLEKPEIPGEGVAVPDEQFLVCLYGLPRPVVDGPRAFEGHHVLLGLTGGAVDVAHPVGLV